MRISESENKSTTFTGRQTSPVYEHTYCGAVLKSHPFYISQTPIKHEMVSFEPQNCCWLTNEDTYIHTLILAC